MKKQVCRVAYIAWQMFYNKVFLCCKQVPIYTSLMQSPGSVSPPPLLEVIGTSLREQDTCTKHTTLGPNRPLAISQTGLEHATFPPANEHLLPLFPLPESCPTSTLASPSTLGETLPSLRREPESPPFCEATPTITAGMDFLGSSSTSGQPGLSGNRYTNTLTVSLYPFPH